MIGACVCQCLYVNKCVFVSECFGHAGQGGRQVHVCARVCVCF
jgi:hypothetical protein